MAIKIAITGNIASGKSTVSNFVKEMGGTLVSCDDINKSLLQDQTYKQLLNNLFEGVITADNEVDIEKLRRLAFSSKENTRKLNDIAHPIIEKKLVDFLLSHEQSKTVYAEVPLLFECNLHKYFDKIWLVVSNKKSIIERAKVRSNVSSDFVEKVLSNQCDFTIIPDAVTDIIENDGTIEELKEKVKKLYI